MAGIIPQNAPVPRDDQPNGWAGRTWQKVGRRELQEACWCCKANAYFTSQLESYRARSAAKAAVQRLLGRERNSGLATILSSFFFFKICPGIRSFRTPSGFVSKVEVILGNLHDFLSPAAGDQGIRMHMHSHKLQCKKYVDATKHSSECG